MPYSLAICPSIKVFLPNGSKSPPIIEPLGRLRSVNTYTTDPDGAVLACNRKLGLLLVTRPPRKLPYRLGELESAHERLASVEGVGAMWARKRKEDGRDCGKGKVRKW